jgi:hypothetical protein
MKCVTLELPTVDGIARASKQFDSDPETKVTEGALADLFTTYPGNTNEAHVLLKVMAVNDLYSTRIPLRARELPNVFDLAKCLSKLNLDQAFRDGSLEIVNTISSSEISGKKKQRKRFSFATKYASCHRQDVYPIWDRNVEAYFSCLRKLYRGEWNSFSDGFALSSNGLGLSRISGTYGPFSFPLQP